MKTKDQKTKISMQNAAGNYIIRFCGIILFALSSAVLSYLTFQSSRISMYSSNKYLGYNWPVEIPDSLVKNTVFCIAALAVIICIFLFEAKHPRIIKIISYAALITVLVSYLILGIAYVLTTPYYPSGDQLNTTAGAMYALEGNYSMFSHLGYIDICPHQKGLLFFYEIIFKLFGPLNYTASGIINLILSELTVLTGFFLIKELKGSSASGLIWTILSSMLLPYWFLIPYAYGDLPSVFGMMIVSYFYLRFINTKKIPFAVISAAGSAFAVLNRSSAWILVFALIIISMLISLQKKKIYPLIGILSVTAFSYACLMCINLGYEAASGYDRHTGSPTTAYIAMGMQTTDGASGVYNRYHQNVYEKYDGDKKAASEEAKEYIRSRIDEFKEDPALAKDFYKNKILLQWTEPMFEVNTHMASFAQGKSLEELSPLYLRAYVGDLHIIFFKIMNKYQSLIYMICFIYCICALYMLITNKKEPDIYEWFFLTLFLGGFIFSLIWEAKARYSLPYFVFMLPIASVLFTDLKAFLRSGNTPKEKEHQQ